jgi:hypothetical protein
VLALSDKTKHASFKKYKFCLKSFSSFLTNFLKLFVMNNVECLSRVTELNQIPKYIVYKGLRYYDPYYFVYKTFCKFRWLGKSVDEILTKEFKTKNFLTSGRVAINGTSVLPGYQLKPNDLITHLVHRHEHPTTNRALEFITFTSKLIVINKPPSLPVHPAGRFNYGSVTLRLKEEYNIAKIYGRKKLYTLYLCVSISFIAYF